MKLLLCLLLLLMLVDVPLSAVDYYVSTAGNDSNAGTAASPWKTIQHAIDSVAAGDSVYVKAGTYEEVLRFQNSGSSDGGYITLTAIDGDAVVLDGTSLIPGEGASAMIWLENVDYIRIKNLEIANYRTSDNSAVPIGVFVTGSSSFIQLMNNHIQHIEQNTDSSQGDAHAIAVYGSNGSCSINNLLIQGNTVNDCKLGSSEAMVLNGNVEQFTITENRVYNCNNIGIDLIGWEGIAANNDQVRNGTVAQNTVYSISSFGNPAYGKERSAAGIYVDGGRDIIIERNRIYECDFGVEVASEHQGKTTSGIIVRNNLIYLNSVAGITFGGYDGNRGVAMNCSFEHNTLFHNDTTQSKNGEFMIQKANDNTIKNNIIYCSDQNIGISNYFDRSDSFNNTFDYNLYYSSGKTDSTVFIINNNEYTGFDNYRQATSQDSHSQFTEPGLVKTVSPYDFHQQPESASINTGDPAFVQAAGEVDYDGNDRVLGSATDCGAYEYKEGGSQYYTLSVIGGSGSGSYVEGEQVQINADINSGQQFLKWTGDTDYVDKPVNAIATVTMPAKRITLTATFIASDVVYLSRGAVVQVAAKSLHESLHDFTRKPHVSASWNSGGNSMRFKVVTKVNKNNRQDVVFAEWSKILKLYDKSDYHQALLSKVLIENPIADLKLDYVMVNYYDKQQDLDIENQKLDITSYIANPIILGVDGAYEKSGDSFIVEGLYFGAKAPLILVEYLKNKDNTKPRYKKCKLVKTATYRYLDSRRRPLKSCMKIYADDTSDNNAVGYSSVTVLYPKISDKDSVTGYIILDNKTGMTVYQVSN